MSEESNHFDFNGDSEVIFKSSNAISVMNRIKELDPKLEPVVSMEDIIDRITDGLAPSKHIYRIISLQGGNFARVSESGSASDRFEKSILRGARHFQRCHGTPLSEKMSSTEKHARRRWGCA